MSQVVRDDQSENAHVVGGGAECPAPAVFEAAGVFDDVVEVLDLHASAVSLFPCGGSEGDLLVGVQLFHGDGDCSFAAVFVFYDGDVGDVAFAGGLAAASGLGVGGDPSVALEAARRDSSLDERRIFFCRNKPCKTRFAEYLTVAARETA